MNNSLEQRTLTTDEEDLQILCKSTLTSLVNIAYNMSSGYFGDMSIKKHGDSIDAYTLAIELNHQLLSQENHRTIKTTTINLLNKVFNRFPHLQQRSII